MSIDIPTDKELIFDWEECYEWIKRCGVIESEDSIYQNQDPALFLMHEMINGVLPLNILNVLSNKEIDPAKYRQFTPYPKESQFDCLTNIKLFNKLAVSYFKMNELDIVDPVNLYNGKEFGKFILLLSKLSKCEFSKRLNIIGFPREDHRITAEHEYYNRLEELAVKKDVYTRRRHDEYYERNAEEEKIYETLVQHKPSKDSMVPVNKSGREMCILEIVESEKNYVESLQILINGYKNLMTNVLSHDEKEIIFKHIEDFFRIHKDLHSKLTIAAMPNKVNVNNFTKLHDIFIEAKPNLLLYGNYCANMQIAQNLVQDMIKTSNVKRTQLEKCQELSKKFRKFPLSDLLTLPMQRILKYHLLLQTLLKWTPDGHPDYEGLKTAHETMKDVASFVNDVKRDQEAILSIDKIQSEMTQIQLPLHKKLSDYGRRQKDGEIKVQLETDTRPKLRHVFIFDKMILLAKRKGDNYQFKDAFYLPDKYPEKTNIQPRKPEKVFPFKINIKNDKRDIDKRSIILFTKSEEMRKQWMDAVETAINNQYPSGSNSGDYHFDMTNFPKYETCHFCHKLLRGIFYQGYKCRITDKICHKECIPKSTSKRMSLDHIESDSCSMSALYNNVTQMNMFNDEPNGHHRINNFRMNSDNRDPFDMPPFEPPAYYQKPNSRVDCYSAEPWYVGELEREEANIMLQELPPGTFLIRISKNHRRHGEFSLSIKDNEPKHMKIQKNYPDNTFYLEEANKFHDLRELVRHYSEACLNDNFEKLEQQDLKLTFPIKAFLHQ